MKFLISDYQIYANAMGKKVQNAALIKVIFVSIW